MISKFKPFQGPMQFVFKDPDTGMGYGPEESKKTLLDRIRLFREQNGLPEIEMLEDVLESYWCTLPENLGRCEPKELKRGILAYFKGGIAVLKNMVYNSYVSHEEAERRASICNTCPHNVFPNKNSFIDWSDTIAYHSLRDEHYTSYDNNLGSCELCSCPLKAKVHLGGDLGVSPEVKHKLPDFCWQK